MQLIVVSSPKKKDEEIVHVIRMFEAGLERFHLRKPGVSKKYLKEFIEQIPKKYRNRVIIHSNHRYALRYKLGGIHISKKHRKKILSLRIKLMWYRMRRPGLIVTRSCHKLGDLTNTKVSYNYVFLSPIYDSISANTLSGGFNKRGLISSMEQSPLKVVAMGGVIPERFQELADLGFYGFAMLGYIWNNNDPMAAFEHSLKYWKELK